jgi:hypothetical protein
MKEKQNAFPTRTYTALLRTWIADEAEKSQELSDYHRLDQAIARTELLAKIHKGRKP